MSGQHAGSPLILFRLLGVLRAIKLYNQSGGRACEVSNELADRELTTKLHARALSIAQPRPETLFYFRLVATQITCVVMGDSMRIDSRSHSDLTRPRMIRYMGPKMPSPGASWALCATRADLSLDRERYQEPLRFSSQAGR